MAVAVVFQFMYDTGITAAQVGWFQLSAPTIIATTIADGTAFICKTYQEISISNTVFHSKYMWMCHFHSMAEKLLCIQLEWVSPASHVAHIRESLIWIFHHEWPYGACLYGREHCLVPPVSCRTSWSWCGRVWAKTRTDVYVTSSELCIQYAAHTYHRISASHSFCSRIYFISMLLHSDTPPSWMTESVRHTIHTWKAFTHRHKSVFTLRVLGILVRLSTAAAYSYRLAVCVCVPTQKQLWIFHLGVVSVW